jgi:hypothetical protein
VTAAVTRPLKVDVGLRLNGYTPCRQLITSRHLYALDTRLREGPSLAGPPTLLCLCLSSSGLYRGPFPRAPAGRAGSAVMIVSVRQPCY